MLTQQLWRRFLARLGTPTIIASPRINTRSTSGAAFAKPRAIATLARSASTLEDRVLLAATVQDLTSNGVTAQALAEALVGSGVQISNVSFTGSSLAAGLFDNGNSDNIGIQSGVVLSSGNVNDVPGPNDNTGTSTSFGLAGDQNLDTLTPAETRDAAVLQFDFTPNSDTVSFNYVFASEEYPDFAPPNPATFNDVFGFFVDDVNIALLPQSNTPVAINNVNAVTNSQFYLDNALPPVGGPSPLGTEFNGLTTTFTAVASVTPGVTTTIKLAVADAADDAFDSAVFLQSGSLTANPVVGVRPSQPTASESPTQNGEYTFHRTGSVANPLSVSYAMSGSATNGEDYAQLAGQLTFAAGQATATLAVEPINDDLFEPTEQATLTLLSDPAYTIDAAQSAASVEITSDDPEPAPEIVVTVNNAQNVADGSSLNWGTVERGQTAVRTFIVSNVGNSPLELSAATISAPFAVSGLLVGDATLQPGEIGEFSVAVTPTENGSVSGTLSFANNDADENPFDIHLNATAVSPEFDLFLGQTTPVASGSTVNLPDTLIGTPIAQVFTIINTGTSDLNLSAATFGGDFTFAGLSAADTLAAGESKSFTASLDGQSLGTFTSSVFLPSNDLDENPYTLSIEVDIVAPEIEVTLNGSVPVSDGDNLVFPNIALNSTLSETLTIQNVGTADLDLAAAAVTGGFQVTGLASSTTLAPGESRDLNVQLTGTSVGLVNGAIAIGNTDVDENPFNIGLEVEVIAPEITVAHGVANVVDGSTVTFPTRPIGADLTETFTITNDGSDDLVLDPATIAGDFSLIGLASPTTIAPGSSTTFQVTRSGQTPGVFQGTLSIGNNDADEDPFDITLVVELIAPEIEVRLGSDIVADGSTVTFPTQPLGTAVAETFTITNLGTDTLTLDPATISGDFSVTGLASPAMLDPGNSTTFSVALDGLAPGVFNGTIDFANNDADENPFNITLTTQIVAPELEVLRGGQTVANNDVIVFPTQQLGTPIAETFTITNTGTDDLTLDPATISGDFIVTGLASPATIAPNTSTTFAVELDGQTPGQFNGSVSFGNNDADEDPFNITFMTEIIAPEIDVTRGGQTVADGDTITFPVQPLGSPLAETFTVQNIGTDDLIIDPATILGDFNVTGLSSATTLSPGQTTTFTVELDGQTPGSFTGSIGFANNDADENPFDIAFSTEILAAEIDVTFGGQNVADGDTLVFPTRPLGTPLLETLTITNIGTDDLSVDPATITGDFTVTGLASAITLQPNASTSVTVQLDGQNRGTFNGNISFVNSDANESPFDIGLTATVSAAEIEVSLDGTPLQDDIAIVDFGLLAPNESATRVFTVSNLGNDPLDLTSLTLLSGSHFSISNGLGSTTLIPGDSTTFEISVVGDAASPGPITDEIEIGNTDGDENPFNIDVVATFLAPEVRVELDMADVPDDVGSVDFGTTFVGTPSTRTFVVTNVGTSDLILEPAVVPAGFNASTNFTSGQILTPGSSSTLVVDLVAAAPGTFAGELSFANSDLDESPYNFGLTGEVVAVPVPEITVTVNASNLSDGGAIDFGATTEGVPVSQTVTITNDGNADLTLDSITLPFGFSSDFVAQTLQPGQSADLVLTLDATLPMLTTGELLLDNNDADENPFNILLTGDVIPATGLIIDDGDPGFSTDLPWPVAVSEFGFRGDAQAAGSRRPRTAFYDFLAIPNGRYEVSATWLAGNDRTTESTYRVLDGSGAELGTATVNQQLSPIGSEIEGRPFEPIGTIVVVDGRLRVELSSASAVPGATVADAVRIRLVDELGNATPEVTDATFDIDEHSPAGTLVGTVIATDADAGQTLSYAILSGDPTGAFSLDPASGEITVTDPALIDFETVTDFNLVVGVTDDGTPRATGIGFITINVLDINDPPVVTLENTVTDLVDGVDVAVPLKVADVVVSDDPNGSFTLSLTGPDASLFTLVGNELFLNDGITLDFNTKPLFEVTVEADDPTIAGTPDGSATLEINVLSTVDFIIDDGDAGYSTSRPWTIFSTPFGFQGDVQAAGQRRARQAYYTFSGLPDGMYEVSATWLRGNDRSSAVVYRLLDGSHVEIDTATVNQKLDPVGDSTSGSLFQIISTVAVSGGVMIIELDSAIASRGAVVADAIRVKLIEPPVTAPAAVDDDDLDTFFANPDLLARL